MPAAKKAVRKKAATATPRKRKGSIVIWKSKKDRKFYFHLASSNGRVVMDNGQGYNRRNNLVKTLRAVAEIFKEGRFEIREST
jgi:uncharacterized protein YegP (UPF0339 family)